MTAITGAISTATRTGSIAAARAGKVSVAAITEISTVTNTADSKVSAAGKTFTELRQFTDTKDSEVFMGTGTLAGRRADSTGTLDFEAAIAVLGAVQTSAVTAATTATQASVATMTVARVAASTATRDLMEAEGAVDFTEAGAEDAGNIYK